MKKVYIYQIIEPAEVDYAFRDYDEDKFQAEDYFYAGVVEVEEGNIDDMLEQAFSKGNTSSLANENPVARSVSTSDILEIDKVKYYINAIGFKELK